MRSFFITALLFLAPVFLFPSAASDSLVNYGWTQWNKNSLPDAEQAFLAAMKSDPNDIRGYIALSYLYEIKGKNAKSWEVYKKGIDKASTPYPYLFAIWITEKFRSHPSPKEAGILDVLLKLAKDKNAAGKLHGSTFEMLGTYYERQNRLDESKKYYDMLRTVTPWLMIGPFDNTSASGFDNVYPPEGEFLPQQSYAGKNDIPVRWHSIATVRNDRWIDFTRYFGYDNSVYYANTFVYSDTKRTVQLRVGTSGSLKTFLNDLPVIEVRDENNNDLDTYIAETELQQGWNRILIKCGYSEISSCNFMLRITDGQGVPLDGIKVSSQPQTYPSKTPSPVRSVGNFAEQFFRERIEQRPDDPENYLLLADAYLRNDKATEAEEVMRVLLKKLPTCSIVHQKLIEIYMRGEKQSEVADIFEKIAVLDPTIPGSVSYQYYQYMNNEDFDNAETKLREFESLLPGERETYSLFIDFYSKKKQVDKLIVYANEAYERYPDEWRFANLRAAIVLQTERQYEPAMAVLQDFLRRNYSTDGLYALAEMHLRANNVKEFEKYFNSLFTLLPLAPGYYLQLAEVYVQLQQFVKAESAVRTAMTLAPDNPTCLEKLGNILRMEGKYEEAKKAFRDALLYQPTRYDSREALRELESKPFIFTRFPSSDARALIRTAPVAEKFPDDAAVYLLDDTKRVVYPEGASEYSREILVKVFNSRGVDYFKEYSIDYNSHSEALIVEKAVVVKSDGGEAKADVDNNTVVFKSLEAGDIIQVKWRVKNFYNGKLSRHFWDRVSFNSFLPASLIRYSLIVPSGRQFTYRMQHSSMKPNIDTLPDGVRYTWVRENVPSMEYEQDMPPSDDVGVILHISSIPSWNYIVDWYSDLAREKTRSSYEIRMQVQELFKEKPNAGEEEKIRTIYNYVTEKIRYSNVSFRQTAYVPQSARNVIVHKLGDCKDMATLCISMLNEVGIKAYHVLVNTRDQGYNTYSLPSVDFNHCIVGVETTAGMKYYDLTAYNYPAGALPRMDQNAFALAIKKGVKEPFYLEQSSFMPRTIIRQQEIVMNGDNNATITKTALRTGSPAGSYREGYRNLGKKDQEKDLMQSLTSDYATVKLLSLAFENLDEPASTVRSTYSFVAQNYVTRAAGLIILKNFWTDRFQPREALSYDQRDFAYHYYPGLDTVRETLTITVEKGLKPVDMKPVTTITSPFGSYKVTYTFSKGVITAVREMIFRKEIITPEEYKPFKEFYESVMREDEKNIVLKK